MAPATRRPADINRPLGIGQIAYAQLTGQLPSWLMTEQQPGEKARRSEDEPDCWRSAQGSER